MQLYLDVVKVCSSIFRAVLIVLLRPFLPDIGKNNLMLRENVNVLLFAYDRIIVSFYGMWLEYVILLASAVLFHCYCGIFFLVLRTDTLIPTLFDRCMTTRRDNPDGTLWRVAVESFNRFVIDDLCKQIENSGTDVANVRSAKIRSWKGVADIYEIFLVGYCGRALPSTALSESALKADESLELNILDILGDKILNSQIDAPLNVIIRPEIYYLITLSITL